MESQVTCYFALLFLYRAEMCFYKILGNVDKFLKIVRLLRSNKLLNELPEDNIELVNLESTEYFLVVKSRHPGIHCLFHTEI